MPVVRSLANPDDFAGMNEAYAQLFATNPPTRAVTKLGLALPSVLVSLAVTAYIDR